jgi:hypothetical protein
MEKSSNDELKWIAIDLFACVSISNCTSTGSHLGSVSARNRTTCRLLLVDKI